MPHSHPMNAPGDFYVEDGICLACLNPEFVAPSLLEYYEAPANGGDTSSCYFKRQPRTEQEVALAIQAVNHSCCDGLRYRGSDSAVIERLLALGKRDVIDGLDAGSV